MTMTIIGDVFPEHRRGGATGSLMTGFSLATVAGVPFGLFLGTNYGWQVPFFVLVLGGLPTLLLTPFALPQLGRPRPQGRTPIRCGRWSTTFSHANHLNAFALIIVLMIAGFSVFPYISAYFVANMGMTEEQLPLIFIVGGGLTLLTSPVIGRLADRFGKLRVYRIISPFSARVVSGDHALAAGRRRRDREHLRRADGLQRRPHDRGHGADDQQRRAASPRRVSERQLLGAAHRQRTGRLWRRDSSSANRPTASWSTLARSAGSRPAATLASLWLAGRIRVAQAPSVSAEEISLAAAAEATVDAGEPLLGAIEMG